MPELGISEDEPQIHRSRTFDANVDPDVDTDVDADAVSESGTYTIDEDNKELEQARRDIDKVFGVVSSPIWYV